MWQAWTEREQLIKWFGPKGSTISHAALDLRPGGTFHYALRSPDGKEMWGKWTFREIVAPKKLVLVSSFSDAQGGLKPCISLNDQRLARIVQRCQDLPGQEIFQYLDDFGQRHPIFSDDVNEYLREVSGHDVTAKDFRTWGGTMVAAVELRAMGSATHGTRLSH